MNPPARAVYVPPRPNLGPEPERTAGPPGWALALLAVALLAALFTGRWVIRRQRRRRAAPPPVPRVDADAADAVGARAGIIAGSETIRAALAERFGPHWRARTTEELVSDPALAQILAQSALEQLAHFLAIADRAKFADEPDERFEAGAYGIDWDGFVREVIAALRPDAGASTKISG